METCNDCIHVAVCGEPHIIYKCSGVCQHFKRETKLNMYDQCEVIEGCTVEILTNTRTGETSVGWWRGGVEDRPGMEGDDWCCSVRKRNVSLSYLDAYGTTSREWKM